MFLQPYLPSGCRCRLFCCAKYLLIHKMCTQHVMTYANCSHFYIVTVYNSDCSCYLTRLPSSMFRLTLAVDVPGRDHDIAGAWEITRPSTSGTYILDIGYGNSVVVEAPEPEIQQGKCWQCMTGRPPSECRSV